MMCLSLNIYHEARGESIMGRHAVALVTMNRAKRDPSKVCEVVFKRKQFSWANGRVTKLGGAYFIDLPHKYDERSLKIAIQIAQTHLNGRVKDFTGGATHYHAKSVQPRWSQELKKVAVIGEHIFYKQHKSRVTNS